MEDMGTILMHMNAFYILTIDIATKLWPLVDDEASLALLFGKIGKGRTEKAGANNQIVVFHI